jgi:hypothetical protein
MIVRDFKNNLNQDKLIRALGARRKRRLSKPALIKTRQWLGRLDSLLKPRLSYSLKPIAGIDNNGIILEDGTCFDSAKLARTLREAVYACCFVATIGPELEKRVQQCLERNSFVDAYILDAIGSIAIEEVVSQFQQRMESQSQEQGRSTTLRFSPGYCDWPIKEQPKVFAQVPEKEALGIHLKESFLMTPLKSISGVFGIQPVNEITPSKRYIPCTECSKKDCRERR